MHEVVRLQFEVERVELRGPLGASVKTREEARTSFATDDRGVRLVVPIAEAKCLAWKGADDPVLWPARRQEVALTFPGEPAVDDAEVGATDSALKTPPSTGAPAPAAPAVMSLMSSSWVRLLPAPSAPRVLDSSVRVDGAGL